MDQSFGARLRLQRERQQVALTAIAAETKIKVSLLDALERDDISRWPEGIFRRAYVRAYARAIGLDPDAVVREFLELHPDPIETIQTNGTPGATTGIVAEQPDSRFRRLLTSVMAAVPAVRHGAATSGAAAPHVSGGAPDRLTDRQPLRPEPNLSAAADLCTRLGRLLDAHQAAPILEEAVAMLDAVGLIVWSWDPHATALRALVAHGYPSSALARIPMVPKDAANAVAAAFRCAEASVVKGDEGLTGAVVIPLMAPHGCVGALAVEFQNGGEQRESVRAFATILAAQLVTLVGLAPLAEAVNE